MEKIELELESGFKIIIYENEYVHLIQTNMEHKYILDITTDTGLTTGYPFRFQKFTDEEKKLLINVPEDEDEAINETNSLISRILFLCITGKYKDELIKRLDFGIENSGHTKTSKNIKEYTVELVTDRIENGERTGIDVWYQKKIKRKKNKFSYNKML